MNWIFRRWLLPRLRQYWLTNTLAILLIAFDVVLFLAAVALQEISVNKLSTEGSITDAIKIEAHGGTQRLTSLTPLGKALRGSIEIHPLLEVTGTITGVFTDVISEASTAVDPQLQPGPSANSSTSTPSPQSSSYSPHSAAPNIIGEPLTIIGTELVGDNSGSSDKAAYDSAPELWVAEGSILANLALNETTATDAPDGKALNSPPANRIQLMVDDHLLTFTVKQIATAKNAKALPISLDNQAASSKSALQNPTHNSDLHDGAPLPETQLNLPPAVALFSLSRLQKSLERHGQISSAIIARRSWGKGARMNWVRLDEAVAKASPAAGESTQSQPELAAINEIWAQLNLPFSLPEEAESDHSQQLTSALRTNLNVMMILTLLITLLVIFQLFYFRLSLLKPEIALLRSIGASKTQLAGLFIAESFVLGICGALLGFALRGAGSRAIVEGLQLTVRSLYLPEASLIPPSTSYSALIAATVGIGAALIGSVFPIFKYSQVHPTTLMRELAPATSRDYLIGSGNYLAKILAFTAFLVSASAFLAGFYQKKLPLLYIGLFTALLWFPALIRFITWRFISIVERARPRTTQMFLALGDLSAGQVALRFSSDIFVLGLSLLVGLAILIRSFETNINAWSIRQFSADFFLRPATTGSSKLGASFSPSIIIQLGEALKPTEESLPFEERFIDFQGKSISVLGTDFSKIRRREIYRFKSGDFPEEGLYQQTCLISESLAHHFNLHVGDLLPAEVRVFGGGAAVKDTFDKDANNIDHAKFLSVEMPSKALKITGIVEDFTRERGVVFLHEPQLDRVTSMYIFGDKNVSSDLRERLAQVIGSKPILLTDHDTLQLAVKNSFRDTFATTKALALVVTLLVAGSLIFSVVQFVILRRALLWSLWAIGVSRLMLVSSILTSTALLYAPSVLFGLLGGGLLSALLIFGVTPFSFGWSLVMQIELEDIIKPTVILITAVLVAASIATYLAAGRVLHKGREIVE